MKSIKNRLALAAAFALLAWLPPATAAQQMLVLPKGTTVQKLAPGQFRFILPDGRKIEARNLNARAGIIGDCGVFDVAGRKQGGGLQCGFRGGPKPVIDPDPPLQPGMARPPSPNYVQIDDEITWLPATLTYQQTGIADPQPPGSVKPGMVSPGMVSPAQRKMLNPQPEPPMPVHK